MNVIQSPPVEIALRTLDPEGRRKVSTWFDYLKKWDRDPSVRKKAENLPSSADVYVLKASNDIWIFFRLEKDRIVVLDLATKETILQFAEMSASEEKRHAE